MQNDNPHGEEAAKRPSRTMNGGPYILDQPERQLFRLNRAVLFDRDVARHERDAVFGRSWLYVGHDSELKQPNDFRTRHVAGRPVIFCRGEDKRVRCLLNSCRHRGTIVCREREGNARRFFCFYHGWTYSSTGALTNVPGEDAYGASFDKSELGLQDVPRFECYRDFWFANFDRNARKLVDDLAGAKEYIDLVVDQSPSGRMEIIAGVQEYDIAANWKLLVENSFDDYHLLTTHATWLGYLKDSGVEMKRPEEAGVLLPARGHRPRPRQWACLRRQREFPRPAGGALDPDLRRGREARDGTDARRAGHAPRPRTGARASPTPTATWSCSRTWC